MREKTIRIILFSLICLNLLAPQHQAQAEVCPSYNLKKIFFEEYEGNRWDNRSGLKNITWSANALVINDESVTRSFTSVELEWLRSAFQSWDDVLDSVEFSEISQSDEAEIVIGYVALKSAPNQPSAKGYWNAWWTNNWRDRATIKLKVSDKSWFSVKNQFIHAVQHELGNVLGLGDILPSSKITSTQEDDWEPPYGPIPLSDYDTGLIRQLYGESTCPSTFPNAADKAAAKKTTITCAKGKLTKKVTAVKPKCPTGYKVKK